MNKEAFGCIVDAPETTKARSKEVKDEKKKISLKTKSEHEQKPKVQKLI